VATDVHAAAREVSGIKTAARRHNISLVRCGVTLAHATTPP